MSLSLTHWYPGILGQVWYLIVSIPDLCTFTYFSDHLLGKVCLLGSLVCYVLLFFVTFPYGILGLVWHLISSISDICLPLHFNAIRVKSGIFGQTAKFGQRPCLFPILE